VRGYIYREEETPRAGSRGGGTRAGAQGEAHLGEVVAGGGGTRGGAPLSMLGTELSLSSRGRMTLEVEAIFWFISHTLPQCHAL
jgi:hypothetical protein